MPLTAVHYTIDRIGRETAIRDAAVLDVTAPGMPALQFFVRGLHAAEPAAAAPTWNELAFVRPARPLITGALPHTASAFDGVSEPGTISGAQSPTW